MDVDIRRVFKLLRHPRTGGLRHQFQSTFNRTLHTLFARCQVEACTISEHKPPAFQRHGLWHDEDKLITLHRRDHGKANAGISGRRLNDRAAGFQAAVFFGGLDHGKTNAVLD